MPTSSYYKYNIFPQDLTAGSHNLASGNYEIALTNTAPVATNTSVNGEISYTNLSARDLTITSAVQTSGSLKWIVADLTITASGAVSTFRYVAVRKKTAGNVVGWYDYGSSLTLGNGDTFKVDLDNVNGIFSLV